MKREILFRGRQIDNGQWVYGYLSEPNVINVEVKDNSTEFLTYDDYYVIPETVGQYTGRQDKNENDIYEGDIVQAVFVDKYTLKGEVVYDQDRFIVKGPGSPLSTFASSKQIEVIGNIHEHTNLLATGKG